MKLVPDFFNKLAKAIDSKYYPNVKYYRDNKYTTNIHYAIELFNNGLLGYSQLINTLSENCKTNKADIHNIVSEYIVDAEGYEYIPK